MKNIWIVVLISMLTLNSCQTDTIYKEKTLPIKVIQEREDKRFDTVLIINDNVELHHYHKGYSDKTYIFNKKEKYIGQYENETNSNGTVVLVFIIAFIIGTVFGFCINNF